MFKRVVFTLSILPGVVHAGECNIADLLYGKVRVELIYNKEYKYETGIIFGDDFNSKRFEYDRVLGVIKGGERDDSHRVVNTDLGFCGVIEGNLSINTEDAECPNCDNKRASLKKVGNGYAVLNKGKIVGTISGRLPN